MRTQALTLEAENRSQARLARITADDLSREQCLTIRRIVTNQFMHSQDYQYSKAAHAFLQGYQEPRGNQSDGWILIELWSDNENQCHENLLNYLNKELNLKP